MLHKDPTLLKVASPPGCPQRGALSESAREPQQQQEVGKCGQRRPFMAPMPHGARLSALAFPQGVGNPPQGTQGTGTWGLHRCELPCANGGLQNENESHPITL